MNPHAAELRRKAMCRLATQRPVRGRAARGILQERAYPPPNPSTADLHCGSTLRHGVPAAVDNTERESQGPNVSTQPTLFIDVATSPFPVVPQAFGQRTLSGVGAFDRASDASFTPQYAAPLPDRPFLTWLKEAAAQQEQLGVELAQPLRVPIFAAESSATLVLDQSGPSLQADMQSMSRPLPLAARVQPVARQEAEQSDSAWVVGSLCAIGLVGLTLWPFEMNAVAYGSFQRYSQIEVAVSPLQAPVVAVHVVTGQRVQAGTPLISLDASALEHELTELNTTLDNTLVAQVQAQATLEVALTAQTLERAGAQSAIEQRAAKKRAELATIEAQRDELLKTNVSPVKLSALDDQVDERRRELQALADEHKHLNAQTGAQLSAASEAEQLAQTVATLRERRVALQHKLHARQVVAAQSGIVTQVVPALGELVDSGVPVVRIVPDNPTLRLVTHFDPRDAKDLRATKQAILTLGADEMVVGAQVVRVHDDNVELKLDDAASVPELDRRLRRDARISLEFERSRSLLALAVERLRGHR